MNLYFNGYGDPSIENMLLRLIKEHHEDIDHIIMPFFSKHNKKDRFEEVLSSVSSIEIEWREHKKLEFANFDMESEKMIPLDHDLIIGMRDCECVVLDMMERNEPIYRIHTYMERKTIYLKMLRYWNHIIENGRIDVFISYTVPHMVYDYVLYCLCKLKQIPTLMFHHSQIIDILFLIDDWKESDRYILEVLGGGDLSSRGFEKSDKVENIIMDTFRNRVLGQNDEIPYLMDPKNLNCIKQTSRQRQGKNTWSYRWNSLGDIAKDVFPKLLNLNNFYWFLKKNSDMRRSRKWYLKHSANVDLNLPYVYLALHMQPECSTSPMAGVFTNQELMVQMISNYLPHGCYIYVKEHPMQDIRYRGQTRSVDFYEGLERLRNVRMVSKDQDTFSLIRNSLAVATATGSAGWEAFMIGKPVLMFGYHYYQSAPGVFAIRSNENCRQALEIILQGKGSVSIEERERFFWAMIPSAVRGFVDVHFKTPFLSGEENTENLYRALSLRLEAMGFW